MLRGDRHLGTDLQPHVVGFQSGGGIHRRRPTKSDEDFRARRWKALAGSDVEGDSLPAARIDLQPQSRNRLHLGVRRDALLRPVAAELTRMTSFLPTGEIAFRTLTFSSRKDSLSVLAGGSMAKLVITWNR
jgi:hypothetical protein